MLSVAIVGGGAAGLSAARQLIEMGAQVTVFEQANVPGGRARSELIENCVVDVGAQLFGSGFTSLFDFARRRSGGAVTRAGRGLSARSRQRDHIRERCEHGHVNGTTNQLEAEAGCAVRAVSAASRERTGSY